MRLSESPSLGEFGASSLGEGMKNKPVAALGADFEHAFGAADLAFLLYNPVIFRAKALAKILSTALSGDEKADNSNHGHSRDHRS
jgi:hypothetical protein